jgi:alpha-1,6-mannosyltransferase
MWARFCTYSSGLPTNPDDDVVTMSAEAPSRTLEEDKRRGSTVPAVRLRRSALLGLLATVSIVIGALLGGRSFENHLPGAWFFGMPGGALGSLGSNSLHPPIYALIAVYGGLVLLARVWFGLLRQLSANHGVPVRRIVCVIAIWAVPFLVGPPLFSHDVYSYAAQGEMVSHHIDPYDYGTGVLGSTPFTAMADGVWTNTPSPYGPTFLAVDGALNNVAQHRELPNLVLLRVLALGGLALVIASVPSLARRHGRDPAEAVLLGVGSPLILTTLVSGAHNDALMLGLLLAGLAVAKRFGTVPGVVLCALAAGVKSPAALGVLFLGWVWAGSGASVRRRVTHTAAAGCIALSTLEIVSLLSGINWGWLRTATAADKSFTAVTPIDALAKAVSGVTHVVNLQISVLGARTVFSVIGLTCAAAIGLVMLWRAPQWGAQLTLGVTLLVVALLGPILWAWYVTWGVLVLAPVVTPRLRAAVIGISTFETFVGASSLKGIASELAHAGLLADLTLVAVLFALAIIPLAQFGRAHQVHLTNPLGHLGLAPNSVSTASS